MPSRHLRLLALLAAVLTALLTSCGGGSAAEPTQSPPALPDGATLLADSATAMRTVTSTRVAIDVQGELPGIPIKSAEGQLTKEGSAQGTATVQMGDVIEVDFVIIGDDLYLRGPTGGYRKLSTSSAFLVYDPTVILDPERGLAGALAAATEAKTQAREQINGVDSYRVSATFPRELLRTLVPGFNQNSAGQVWIAVDGSRLVQAQLPTTGGAITFQFTDFDAPVDIVAPI